MIYLINSSKECTEYVKAVGKDNVKVMLDTYHMCLEEDSFRDAILTAGSYLGHVHVGENNRKLPGMGHIIDWEEIGQALNDIHYTGNIVMEPFVIHGGEVGTISVSGVTCLTTAPKKNSTGMQPGP